MGTPGADHPSRAQGKRQKREKGKREGEWRDKRRGVVSSPDLSYRTRSLPSVINSEIGGTPPEEKSAEQISSLPYKAIIIPLMHDAPNEKYSFYAAQYVSTNFFTDMPTACYGGIEKRRSGGFCLDHYFL